MSRNSNFKVIPIRDDLTVIRLLKTTRDKLCLLKRGNAKRKNSVDTYDDVINRLIEKEGDKNGK